MIVRLFEGGALRRRHRWGAQHAGVPACRSARSRLQGAQFERNENRGIADAARLERMIVFMQ